jgi:hypothetical protein
MGSLFSLFIFMSDKTLPTEKAAGVLFMNML